MSAWHQNPYVHPYLCLYHIVCSSLNFPIRCPHQQSVAILTRGIHQSWVKFSMWIMYEANLSWSMNAHGQPNMVTLTLCNGVPSAHNSSINLCYCTLWLRPVTVFSASQIITNSTIKDILSYTASLLVCCPSVSIMIQLQWDPDTFAKWVSLELPMLGSPN